MIWVTKNGGCYESLEQLAADRALMLNFGGGYLAFCNQCGNELDTPVFVGVTGVGVHQHTVFECSSCELRGSKIEPWVETCLYFAKPPDLPGPV